jgi:plastocyanin
VRGIIGRSSRGARSGLLLWVALMTGLTPAADAAETEMRSLEAAGSFTFRSPAGGGSSRPAGQTFKRAGAEEVDIRDFEYFPKRLEVRPGVEVIWTNFDTAEHSATDIGGDFDTGLLADGESGSVTLAATGTYDYICSLHPEMTGTLVVARNDSGGGGKDSGTGGVSPDGAGDEDRDDSGVSATGTSGSSGFDSGGFDSPGAAAGSGGTLPMTGFEVVRLILAAAALAAMGLILRAMELSLRPLPRGPGRE